MLTQMSKLELCDSIRKAEMCAYCMSTDEDLCNRLMNRRLSDRRQADRRQTDRRWKGEAYGINRSHKDYQG